MTTRLARKWCPSHWQIVVGALYWCRVMKSRLRPGGNVIRKAAVAICQSLLWGLKISLLPVSTTSTWANILTGRMRVQGACCGFRQLKNGAPSIRRLSTKRPSSVLLTQDWPGLQIMVGKNRHLGRPAQAVPSPARHLALPISTAMYGNGPQVALSPDLKAPLKIGVRPLWPQANTRQSYLYLCVIQLLGAARWECPPHISG